MWRPVAGSAGVLMRGRDAFGTLGIGVLAVICCAGLPAVLAFAGGLTVVGLLGGGLAAAVVGFAAMVVARRGVAGIARIVLRTVRVRYEGRASVLRRLSEP
jgi:hypothetical protein